MAHFCLLVVTERPGDVAAAMEPYRLEEIAGRRGPHWIFVDDRHADTDPDTGRRGYWKNPLGKWDGFVTGGNWWGLLGQGHWGPETYVEADYDRVNRIRGADIADRLLARPDRLDEVHATLFAGRWSELSDVANAAVWRAELRRVLGTVAEDHWVSVMDCHC